MSKESEPFLPIDEGALERSEQPKPVRGSCWPSTRSLACHIALVVLYTVVSVTLVQQNRKCAPTNHGPLHDLDISYVERTFHNLTDNIYAGPPSDKLDAAWDALLGNMNLRVTSEELQQYDQSSVALPEGGGYLAWLGSIHEIHCIKMLREWKYRDHYHPNLTEIEYTHWDSHADHCLDLLRQTALCHADTSLTTFVWNSTKSKPMFDAKDSRHTCANWDALTKSTEHRAVSIEEMQRLQNPLRVEGVPPDL